MPNTADGRLVQVWRAPTSLWIAAVVTIAGQAVLCVWIDLQFGHGDLLVAFIAPTAYLLLDTKLWFQIIVPRTVAGPDGVTIRSGRGTTHLAWTEIGRCEAGYWGIAITCLNGRTALARMPQKSNIAGWAGRSTEADKVAAYLELRAKYYREGIELDADFPETPQ